MKHLTNFFNELRQNSGAIWIENDALVFSAPKKFQTEETKRFITSHKDQILSVLNNNSITSKERFAGTIILKSLDIEHYPLSPAQERLWFVEQYEEGTNAYHIPDVMALAPGVDREGIRYAFQRIVERHEVLRSTIEQPADLDYGIQVVHHDTLIIEEVSLSGKDDVDSLIKADSSRPFDLSKEYPIRVKFYNIESATDPSSNKTLLLLTVHHIAKDGWSNHILQSELACYYEAYVNRKMEFRLPPLEIQYKDYALWQRSYLTGTVLESELNYWRNKLSGFQPLEFPTDYARPVKIDYKGAGHGFRINRGVSKRLRELAQQLGVTLNSVMLSAFNILLSKYTGQQEIVTGSPTANRQHRQTEGLIGFFVNTQVNRAILSNDQNFEELIKKVYHDQVDAQLYQDLPFIKLVDELKVQRDLSRHPIFQIIFEVQGFGNQNNTPDNRKNYLEPYEIDNLYEVERFDLSVFINASEEELIGHIGYATSLFHPDTISRFAGHYTHLLQQLSLAPVQPYSQFSLLDEAEYRQIIYQWNDTDKDYPSDKTIIDLFEEQVSRTPDKVAVVCEGNEMSYRQLSEQAGKLAAYLKATYEVQANDRIGIMLNRSDKMIVAIMGILKAGAAYVCIDPTYPQARKEYIFGDTSLKVLITQSDYLFDLDYYAGNLFAIDLQLDSVADFEPSVTDIKTGDLAYVIYTSGTTGKPKGVMISHRSVANYAFNVNEVLLKDVASVDFSTNIAFDLTLTTTVCALLLGKTIFVYTGELSDIDAYAQHLVRNSIDFVKSTPSLLANLNLGYFTDHKIKQAFIGGEKLEKLQLEHISRYVNHPIDEYGPTEATVGTTYIDKSAAHARGIGKPYFNYKVYVLDHSLRPVPVGVKGQLYIGGAGLAKGYLNREALTAERFVANPFGTTSDKAKGYDTLYVTGDIARWLPDGSLEYIGRNDDQVKIRGYRIELAEIEHAIAQLTGIRQACVIAKERLNDAGASSKYLVGYYIPDDTGVTPDERAVSEKLLQVLPEYMVPAIFIKMESFPLTANGKLDKRALPDRESEPSVEGYIKPQNAIEEVLCVIWQSVLGLERVGTTDNFFSIGGDSILSIQVSSRIRQAGYACQVKDIFECKTIAKLAEHIGKKNEEVTVNAEQGFLSGELGLLPIQQWFFERVDSAALAAPSHWNQSFLIRVKALDRKKLQYVIQNLVAYHDVLRIRYVKEGNTNIWGCHWKQFYQPAITMPEIKTLDVSKHTEDEVTQILTAWQSSFDLKKGYLFQPGYLYGYEDGSARIYFALHHLVIDTVSWRILTEDVKTLCSGVSLPSKGSSYRQWVSAIAQYPDLHPAEAAYWSEKLKGMPAYNTSDCRKDTSAAYIELDEKITKALLQQAPGAYHTEVNDLLLTAFAYALKEINQQDVQGITLEGHGREEIDASIDHSRTVGWFTTMFPVKLEVKNTMRESIQCNKESLRNIPNKGIGFGAFATASDSAFSYGNLPPVTFNYLGQFDGQQQDDWQITPGGGSNIHPDNADQTLIKAGGMVREGKLGFNLVTRLGETVTKLLSDNFRSALLDMVQHCTQALEEKGKGYTPGDFKFARVSQDLIDRLQAEARSHNNEVVDIYPATSLQQGFIYHVLSQSEDDAYRVQLLFDYHEALDVDLFIEAFRCCVAQYPALRTAFNWDEDLMQVIYRKGELQTYFHDISHLETQEARDAAIEAIQASDRQQAFDLTRPTLLRINIIRQAEACYTVLKTEHHSIADGWSWPILFKKVHAYYATLLKGESTVVAEDTAYAKAQQYIGRNKGTAQKFWKEALAQVEAANDISGLLSRPIDVTAYKKAERLGTATMEITGAFYNQIKALAAKEGLTANILVQFIWHKFLQVFSNSSISIVGTTVSGRDIPVEGVEESVGLYINTLPLVVDWQNNNSVTQQLQLIQQQLTTLNTHSIADLAKMQKGGESLFNSLLVFENYPRLSEEENTRKISLRGAMEKVSYPLSVLAYDLNDSLVVRLKYDCDYLAESRATDHLSGLRSILRQVVDNPEMPHRHITLLNDTAYDQIVRQWNATAKAFPNDTTVVRLFEVQVAKTPANIAVVYGGQQLTYKELNEKSNQVARFIRSHYENRLNKTFAPDTLVALCLDRSLEMLVGTLAILKAGGAYVPIDAGNPQERIDYILEDTKTELVLTRRHANDGAAGKLPEEKCAYIDLTDDLYNTGDTANVERYSRPGNLAYVIYTSGTTGKPKGAELTHGNLVNLCFNVVDAFDIDSDTVASQFISISFDAAVAEIHPTLIAGATVSILPDEAKQNGSLSTSLASHGITHMTIPADLMESMENAPLPELKTIHVGGGVNSVQCLQKWSRDRKVINAYGPTEGSVTTTMHQYVKGDLNTNIGKPIANTSAYVLDANLVPVPVGVIGELYIGGAGLAKGYLNRPDLTAERFILNPFATVEDKIKGYNRLYKTGDLVRWSYTGDLEYMGRNDDQVKIRGYRIELGEIEHALSQLAGIRQACVLAKERKTDAGNTKYLVAYYVPEPDRAPDQAFIAETLGQLLPGYMVPDAFVKMESFPLTINGKLDKRSLPDPEFNFSGAAGYVRPETKLEIQLCEIYAQVLGLPADQVSTHQNFFKMGGNSILSIQLKRRLNQLPEFEHVSIAGLFKYNSIHKLIQSIQPDSAPTYKLQGDSGHIKNHEIAIIGMSGAFSGAGNVDDLWSLISNQQEGTRIYSREECERLGVPYDLLEDPDYIPVAGKIEGVDLFDTAFWDISPNEARQTDPQIRKFIEHCWLALESSGYASKRRDHHIGVFAGSGEGHYFYDNIINGEMAGHINLWEAAISNSKDALATKAAYMLNLSGPATSVNTACSTGLVSVVEACKNLQVGSCDMALAGGVAFSMPDNIGYVYRDGMIFSRDGHCRTFDKDSSGTVSGSGVAVVLLKRLEDAIKDNDNILGVIKGFSTNNDGARKTGYTAPSVIGQSECIINAQRMAGVTSDQIDYVECHGTATYLGDPIEVQALREAFEHNANKEDLAKGKTLLGSVKANIGHTGSAAGAAGLIKICVMLRNDMIAGQVNFNEPNPELRLHETRFEVNKENKVWAPNAVKPRLAAVSSFGIGGTNAHVIVGDYVCRAKTDDGKMSPVSQEDKGGQTCDINYIIPLSAKTRTSLERYRHALLAYLDQEDQDKVAIGDIAYTLQEKREQFNFRTAFSARSVEELRNKLNAETSYDEVKTEESNPLVFMFPGQGVQYAEMARGLYNNEPGFRNIVDACIAIANRHLDAHLFDVLYPGNESPRYDINEIKWTPISLFIIEYALARYLDMLGIKADAYIGHSFGEYVAATLAGVFTIEDAIKVVITRGRLMQSMQPGSMLAINASEQTIRAAVEKFDCEISVVNSPEDVVASGSTEAIEALHRTLTVAGIPTVKVNSLVAGHSRMMERASIEFAEVFKTVKLTRPAKNFISNLTGEMAGEEVATAGYWCRQLRNPVQLARGIENLSRLFNHQATFIEIGPGKGLSYFVNKHKNASGYRSLQTVQLLPSAKEVNAAQDAIVSTKEDLFVKLWMSGVIQVPNEPGSFIRPAYRADLPCYQFDQKRCWINKREHAFSATDSETIIARFANELRSRPVLSREEAVELLVNALAPTGNAKLPAETEFTGVNIVEEDYTEKEEVIAQLFCDVLGVEQISIHDNFFKIGGNSILAIQLSHRMTEVLGYDVKVSDVFKLKSCRALVKNLKVREVSCENVEKDY